MSQKDLQPLLDAITDYFIVNGEEKTKDYLQTIKKKVVLDTQKVQLEKLKKSIEDLSTLESYDVNRLNYYIDGIMIVVDNANKQ